MHHWLGQNGVETDPNASLDLSAFKSSVLQMINALDMPRVKAYVDQAILNHNSPAARARIKTSAFFMDVYKSDEGLYYGLLHTTPILNGYRYRGTGEVCLSVIVNLETKIFLTEPEYAIQVIPDNPMPWKVNHSNYYNCVTRMWLPDWMLRLEKALEIGMGVVGTMRVDLLPPSILSRLK
jgi:hypothetical protein